MKYGLFSFFIFIALTISSFLCLLYKVIKDKIKHEIQMSDYKKNICERCQIFVYNHYTPMPDPFHPTPLTFQVYFWSTLDYSGGRSHLPPTGIFHLPAENTPSRNPKYKVNYYIGYIKFKLTNCGFDSSIIDLCLF